MQGSSYVRSANKKGKMAAKVFRSIIGTSMSYFQEKRIPDSIREAIFECNMVPIKKDVRLVLILDDLERCTIDINDLYGVINLAAEHDGFRVIIVANTVEMPENQLKIFEEKKEKVIAQTIAFEYDRAEIIRSIIERLRNTDQRYSCFLLSEIDNISKISSIVGVFNARSIQRAIAIFAQFYSCFIDNEISNNAVKEIFRCLVFVVTLIDNSQITREETEAFTFSPWSTLGIISDGSWERSFAPDGEGKTPLTEDEKRAKKVLQIISEYPFNKGYFIPTCMIDYMNLGKWDVDQINIDCQEIKALEITLDDTLVNLMHYRLYQFGSYKEFNEAVERVLKGVKLYPVKRTRERVTFEPTSPVYGR